MQDLAGFEVRPSMDELLDAFEEAVRQIPSDIADTLGARSVRVVDWPERRHAAPDPALTEHLRAGLQAVSRTYQKHVGRSPHIPELLEVMAFELADDASPYVRDATQPFTRFVLA